MKGLVVVVLNPICLLVAADKWLSVDLDSSYVVGLVLTTAAARSLTDSVPLSTDGFYAQSPWISQPGLLAPFSV